MDQEIQALNVGWGRTAEGRFAIVIHTADGVAIRTFILTAEEEGLLREAVAGTGIVVPAPGSVRLLH